MKIKVTCRSARPRPYGPALEHVTFDGPDPIAGVSLDLVEPGQFTEGQDYELTLTPIKPAPKPTTAKA